MRTRLPWTLVAALVALPVPLVGQEAPETLTLARAITMARSHNPTLAGAAAEVAVSAARIAPAGALPDPTVTLGAMNYMLPDLSIRGSPLGMNQLTVMQMLPVNGSLRLLRRAARFDSTRAEEEREAMGLDVEREVRMQYWELYHADRALEVMGRSLTVLRELTSISTSMYAVGGAAQSDVVRAQVAATRLQQEIATMELERYRAAVALNVLLGRDPEVPIALPGAAEHAMHGEPAHALALPAPAPLDTLVAWAEAANPELRAGAAAVGGAEAGEQAARRMKIPDLGLGLAYGQRPGEMGMLSAMVTVSVPVFARSRQDRMRDEARAMRTVAEQRLIAARQRIRGALASARAEAETARRLVALYARSLVPQASAGYEAALSAYRAGRVDFMTVLDAQMALLDYEHELHRHEAMYGTALAAIDQLTGRAYDAAQEN